MPTLEMAFKPMLPTESLSDGEVFTSGFRATKFNRLDIVLFLHMPVKVTGVCERFLTDWTRVGALARSLGTFGFASASLGEESC